MSVHFVSGKPGGGKSLYGVRMLVDELRVGSRMIVTNLPLRMDRLNEYLQERGIEWDKGPWAGRPLSDRVRVMSEDESYRFWEHRERGVEIVDRKNVRGDMVPDFSNAVGGVLYIIDEVHIYYNARQWAQTGAKVLFYLSQHRKLGDDCILITQHVNNVDRQMRSVAQDYSYIRNLSKEKMGLFTLPNMFMRRVFAEPATATTPCMEMGTFKLDVNGLASCYDTAAGVGILGRTNADVGRRKKGLHWSTGIGAFCVAAFLLWWLVPKAIGGLFKTGDKVKKMTNYNVVNTNQAPSPGKPLSATEMLGNYLGHTNQPAATNGFGAGFGAEPELRMTGFFFLNGRFRVMLSDGSTASNIPRGGDLKLDLLTERYCVIGGRTNYMVNGPNEPQRREREEQKSVRFRF